MEPPLTSASKGAKDFSSRKASKLLYRYLPHSGDFSRKLHGIAGSAALP